VFEEIQTNELSSALQIKFSKNILAEVGEVKKELLSRFEIKQPVFFIDFNWSTLSAKAKAIKIQFEEVAKYPSVERDLAIIVSKDTPYQEIVSKIQKLQLKNLKEIRLFDIFQSEKFGNNKHSMAINFIFLDEQKTLTDKEIELWMNKIITTLENEVGAEVRK
jgi:phenylalanyl-tRNA synthetase beta chain